MKLEDNQQQELQKNSRNQNLSKMKVKNKELWS